ncbi:MAG: helix-hairpin-helix domain-containing protein, partial [Myxococcota bacterium]
AARILAQPKSGDPDAEAAQFLGDDVENADAALAGARDIVAESLTENFQVRATARRRLFESGRLQTRPASKKIAAAPSKFEDYFDFETRLANVPSHRYLALCRGEAEKALRVTVVADNDRIVDDTERALGFDRSSPFSEQLRLAVRDGVIRLLLPSLTNELRSALKARADEGAVEVFAENLRNLIMASPFGARAVVGLDPGIRTGHKLAAIDKTGAFVDHTVIYVRKPTDEAQAAEGLIRFVRRHKPDAIAVGNGTGGREAERFVRRALQDAGLDNITVVSVNEAGASVYSASDAARREFPDLDLTVRGAISIGRRLQDPLAELVKVDPKSVGVGQYQHDVHQPVLQAKLTEVIESCVHDVGVELNTASPELIRHVSGIGPKLAERIVAHRHQKGAFTRRHDLTRVPGLGPRAFEQAAGFLRIREGKDPLDRSAVHPERYALVAQIAQDAGISLTQLVGDASAVDRIEWTKYVNDEVGHPTLNDIAAELKKPGRDPRDAFEAPSFAEGIETLEDVQTGMQLDGVVTNVTKFGAFVDVGVHQDGLVHVSQLADRFVSDPADVVRVGDRVKVRVLDVDLQRRRLSLSMRAG